MQERRRLPARPVEHNDTIKASIESKMEVFILSK